MPLKNKIIVSLIAAVLIAVLVVLAFPPKHDDNKKTTATIEYSVTSATTTKKNEKSDLFTTVIFLGTDFTIGRKADSTFVDQLEDRKIVNSACFADKKLAMVDSKRDNYITMLHSIPTRHAAPALLMCEVSYYDAKWSSEIGELSDSYDLEDFDTSTVIGAMEYIVCYTQQTWGCTTTFYTNYCMDDEDYEALVDAMYLVCEKWDIDYLDLYNDFAIRLNNDEKKAYMQNKLDPNEEGYKKVFTPVFENYLKEKLNI